MDAITFAKFLTQGASALTIFKDNAEVIEAVSGVIDRGTRYVRVVKTASGARGTFIEDATADLAALVKGNKAALAGQLKRIRDLSARIAEKTALLEERRDARG
jgi:hypothetical protein